MNINNSLNVEQNTYYYCSIFFLNKNLKNKIKYLLIGTGINGSEVLLLLLYNIDAMMWEVNKKYFICKQ